MTLQTVGCGSDPVFKHGLNSKSFSFFFVVFFILERGIQTKVSLLDELSDKNNWLSYREHKVSGQHISRRELEFLDDFINEERYLEITSRIYDDKIPFDYPHKRTINKSGTQKKRIVYTYSDSEMQVLKLMMFLLSRYEDKLSPKCYSFRKTRTVKGAIFDIVRSKVASNSYTYKVDIHNYFNSMDVDILIQALKTVITDDEPLIEFLSKLLKVNKAYDGDTEAIVEENRGGMAGTPISPFFANVYLKSLDDLFDAVSYYRYSDDILIFAREEKELQIYKNMLEQHIKDKKLELNPDKVAQTSPYEAWEFLGFSYFDGKIDLSYVTINKIKAKIKRKANKLYRWRIRKGAPADGTAKAMIRIFNHKFYGLDKDEDDFTWSRWFFPILDTADSLKLIDDYLIEYIRFIYSGRHYKGNYKITYEHIKELGFRSLVNEFYKTKER